MNTVVLYNSASKIGQNAFEGCTALKTIIYYGTVFEWDAIDKGEDWDKNTNSYTIYCTDGEIAKDGTVTLY